MSSAFVLMTAMPPTLGHLDLIKFAGQLYTRRVVVLLNTQPDEPMVTERYQALWHALNVMNTTSYPGKYEIRWQNEATQQEPVGGDDDAFWENWVGNLRRYGFEEGDYIVASEPYGVELARRANGVFMPYDLERWARWTKGTLVRNDWVGNWGQIIPEFRKYLQKRVTIFGAESTGKTTLTRSLSDQTYSGISTKLFEWARPYLELTGPDVTLEAMERIWEGQAALQRNTYDNALTPMVIQDTDLWTTVGFWEDWRPGTVPPGLYFDATMTKSDLYIITRSNIPFEHDILRYGGDERQTTDQYWIDLCVKYRLPYVVLDENALSDRVGEAADHISSLFDPNPLTYQRQGAEYESSSQNQPEGATPKG